MKIVKLYGDTYFIKNGCELELVTKANFPVFPNPDKKYGGPMWITPLTTEFVAYKNTYCESGYKYIIANDR